MLPAALLATMTILCSPVVETCLGEPTDGIRYEFSYRYWECARWGEDWDAPACPRFEARVETEATMWETVIGSPDPPVGGGYFYRVRSRNALGLWSDDACLP
jgi:hypothetical protein